MSARAVVEQPSVSSEFEGRADSEAADAVRPIETPLVANLLRGLRHSAVDWTLGEGGRFQRRDSGELVEQVVRRTGQDLVFGECLDLSGSVSHQLL